MASLMLAPVAKVGDLSYKMFNVTGSISQQPPYIFWYTNL